MTAPCARYSGNFQPWQPWYAGVLKTIVDVCIPLIYSCKGISLSNFTSWGHVFFCNQAPCHQ